MVLFDTDLIKGKENKYKLSFEEFISIYTVRSLSRKLLVKIDISYYWSFEQLSNTGVLWTPLSWWSAVDHHIIELALF